MRRVACELLGDAFLSTTGQKNINNFLTEDFIDLFSTFKCYLLGEPIDDQFLRFSIGLDDEFISRYGAILKIWTTR